MTILKGDKTAVFLTRILPILNGQTRKKGPTLDRFDRYIEDMLHRLFPGQTAVT
jgi:hypothetical protein